MRFWNTGNFDARNLAVKVVDPARYFSELDLGPRGPARGMSRYVAMLARKPAPRRSRAVALVEEPKGRSAGWCFSANVPAAREATPDAFFEKRLAEIERTIHARRILSRG